MAADATYQAGFQVRQDGNAAVPSGYSLDVESGGSLKLAGTAITKTAAQINALPIVEQAHVAALGTTTDLSAIAAEFADLAAARTAVNTLATEVEARLDAVEAKIDAVIAALEAANVLAAE